MLSSSHNPSEISRLAVTIAGRKGRDEASELSRPLLSLSHVAVMVEGIFFSAIGMATPDQLLLFTVELSGWPYTATPFNLLSQSTSRSLGHWAVQLYLLHSSSRGQHKSWSLPSS